MLRQLVWYSDLEQGRKDHFVDLLTVENFSNINSEEASELMDALPAAQDKLEQIVIDSNDAEKIYALANLKSFTYNLLNNAEEGALQKVLDIAEKGGGASPSRASSKVSGEQLLNKLAGFQEEESPAQSPAQ